MKTNIVNMQFDARTSLPPRAQAFRPRTMHFIYTGVAKAQCAGDKSRPGTDELYPLHRDYPRYQHEPFFLCAKAPSSSTTAGAGVAQRIRSEEHYPRSSPVTAQASKASLRDAVAGITQFPQLHRSLPTLQSGRPFAQKPMARSTLQNSIVAVQQGADAQSVECAEGIYNAQNSLNGQSAAKPFPSLPSGFLASEPTVQNFAMALPNESQMVRFEVAGLQFACQERCEFFNDNSSVTTVDEAESS